jgi:hypothetical protein
LLNIRKKNFKLTQNINRNEDKRLKAAEELRESVIVYQLEK